MQEIRHGIFLTIVILGLILPRLILAGYPLESVYTSFGIFVSLFVDAILSYILFGSIIVSLVYFLTVLSLIDILNYTNLVNIYILFPYSMGLATALFFGLIIRRKYDDEFLSSLKKISITFNFYTILVSLVFLILAIIIYLYIYYSQLLLIGSVIAFLLLLISGKKEDSPLILSSWIFLPYLMSQIGSNREEKGICIGEIIAILKRASFSSSKISTNSNYKWVSYKSKFYINMEKNKNFNIIIVGGSGSGKSHLAKNIIRKGKFHFLIFDIHGEYDVNAKRIDVSKISINPLSLFGQSPRQRALEVAYMIKSIFNLGSLQTIDLSNIIIDAYGEKGIFEDDERTWNLPPPNFRDVLMLLEKKKKLVTTAQELNKIQSLEPYIYFLATNTFMDNSINLYDLIIDDYVLDFSKVTIPEIKYVIIETILRSILAFMYISGQSNFRKMIVIDEAPFILSKESGEQIMERLFAESRKFGFGFILISQSVEYVRKLIPNTSYVFALNIVDPTEIDFISRLIGGQDPDIFKAIYNSLPKLERGLIITRDILRDEIILVRSN